MGHRDSGQTVVTTYEVKDLLKLARQGRLRLPEFQRPPRWRARHVVDLFDSIRHGYPIGTLLFGEREAAEGPVYFGAFHATVPSRRDALWVVDGQQRLNAILGVLLHPDEAPRGDINAIWFDLLENRFVHVRRDPPAVSVPLRALGDPQTTLRWADSWPLRPQRPDLVTTVFELAEIITEFSVSVAVVREGGEDALREIFRRLNNSGVAMKDGEIFDALFGHLAQGKLARPAARVSAAGFGSVSEETFLRALLAVHGLDPGTTPEELPPGEVPAMAQRTEEALRAAFTFLATEAEVPHLTLLPYLSSPLRVLARFFARFERPSPRALTLLGRWFWRGCVGRQFASASQGIVRRLQKCVDEAPSAERAAGALIEDQGRVVPRLDLSSSTFWRSRDAECRLVALSLLHLRPRDPSTGVAMGVDEIAQVLPGGAAEDAETAEQESVGDRSPGEKSLSELCVDILHGPSTGPLVRRVILRESAPDGWWLRASSETLGSHALTAACVSALRELEAARDEHERTRALERFDAARAERLNAVTAEFFEERCGADEDDRVSIAEIVRETNLRLGAA